MNETTYKKMQLGDAIIANVMKLHKLSLKYDDVMYKTNNGVNVKLEWDEMVSLMIEPITHDGLTYVQINIWGDGTLELQDDSNESESINWSEFPNDFLEKLNSQLDESVKKMLNTEKDLEKS